ncbi:MAG: dTDP-4-dehydrorhamnose 3,5-epimerase [Blastocatellia bacterium]|nr:dTDP-4-dehydrorhamnose 3,5-epimerase [Blastocatellia bacterium]
MIFTETKLAGAFVIDLDPIEDSRGFFARSWSEEEFVKHGLTTRNKQANVSFNRIKGTLRGMHRQAEPFAEVKLVRCTRGAIVDVIIDLRPDSPTYMQWTSVELTGENHRMLYVPENFAHGFQTLEDNTEVTYQVSEVYTPSAERGIRFDDPAFGIEWPLAVEVISDKDRTWADFKGEEVAV